MKTALLISVLAALPMLAQQPQGAPQAPQAPAPVQAPQAAQQHRHGHHMGMPGQRPQWAGKQAPQRPQWNKQAPQRPQWANNPLVQTWQKMTPEQRKQTVQQVAGVVKQIHQRHQQMAAKQMPQRAAWGKKAQRPVWGKAIKAQRPAWGKKVQRPAWGKPCCPCRKAA